ncbi:MAG: helix-turn-helix domain-containing protein [Chitinivibrionales bacterium]|nr:helix-turn-helix domain-containing protein [Chitinivibrionales bacterium]
MTDPTLRMRERMEDDYPLVVMSLEQENIAPHGHDFVELVYVNAGSGVHEHAGRRYPIFAGDCFAVLPGERHGYAQGRDLHITNVLFVPELLRHHASDLTHTTGFVRFFAIEPLFRRETAFRHKLHLSASAQQTVRKLCAQLGRELRMRESGYKSLCTGLLLQLVVFVSRCFDKSIQSSTVREDFDGKQSMVQAAIAYLESNYADDVRVDDIARSAFISPSRLSHVFKDTTGMSLMDYLTQIRIDRAQQLLAETDESITAISFELGIQSPTYFTRLFRRMTGVSPSEYRKSAR